MIRVCFRNTAVITLATAVLGVTACNDEEQQEVVEVPPVPTPPEQQTITGFQVTTLVTNQNDPNLINAWGIVADRGFFSIADNGTGRVSVFDVNGRPAPQNDRFDLGEGITGVARIPEATDVAPLPFQIPCADRTMTGQAELVFASEKGFLIAINDASPTTGVRVVDRSSEGAVFKGVARIDMTTGPVLLAADFVNARIDVFDAKFQQIKPAAGAPVPFADPQLPAGFGPFNVMTFNNQAFVMEAKIGQDGDEQKGAGLGAIAVFDSNGAFLTRITSDQFNAPWGLALADATSTLTDGVATFFVGNFGDGHITRFDANTLRQIGQLTDLSGNTVVIDGLWGLQVGNDQAGSPNLIQFAAGPLDETAGAFGRIERVTQTIETNTDTDVP